MVERSIRFTQEQLGSYTGALTKAPPTGGMLYVDSNKGQDGYAGIDPRFPLKTLTRAVVLAEAGDTIIPVPGGSETITATIAVAVARLRIVCSIEDYSDSGFNIISTGALVDQMTVAGADCHFEGLKFTRSIGAGAANAGINAAATADRLSVVNCLFSGSLLTSSWTSFGIELTDALQHPVIRKCQFRDMHRGIINVIATGIVQVGGLIEDCIFWVGRPTAFGYHNNPTSTGTSGGIVVRRSHFHEIIASSGAAATDVWDGTNGTDAASGPAHIGALCDRLVFEDCTAYTASTDSFSNLTRVDAGGLVDFVGNTTSAGVAGVTAISTALADAIIADSLAFSIGVAERATNATADSLAASFGVVADAANATAALADSLAASFGVVAATAGSTAAVADSLAASQQVADGQADADADSLASSFGVVADTAGSTAAVADSTAASIGVVAATADSTAGAADSVADSIGVVAVTADSLAASIGVVADTADSTASVSDSLAFSLAVIASTAKGQPFVFSKTLADTDIPDNVQTFALLTATGDIYIESIIFQRSGANMTGPTNVEFGTGNAFGPTGATVIASAVLADWNANLKLIWESLGVTAGSAFMLEDGRELWIWGDNAPGAGGSMDVIVKGYRVTDGASLA